MDNINKIYKKLKEIMAINKEIDKMKKIIYGGKEYPFTQWNFDRIYLYGKTKDKKILDEMTDFSLDFD